MTLMLDTPWWPRRPAKRAPYRRPVVISEAWLTSAGAVDASLWPMRGDNWSDRWALFLGWRS